MGRRILGRVAGDPGNVLPGRLVNQTVIAPLYTGFQMLCQFGMVWFDLADEPIYTRFDCLDPFRNIGELVPDFFSGFIEGYQQFVDLYFSAEVISGLPFFL